MTDVPSGYYRNEKGVLMFKGGSARLDRHNEAIFFSNGHGEYFGCAEHVMKSYRSYPCGKKAKHDPDKNGNPTRCGIHSRAAKERRQAKSEAACQAWQAKLDRQGAQTKLAKEAIAIVRAIAEGHNDPRSICLDWVKRMDEIND